MHLSSSSAKIGQERNIQHIQTSNYEAVVAALCDPACNAISYADDVEIRAAGSAWREHLASPQGCADSVGLDAKFRVQSSITSHHLGQHLSDAVFRQLGWQLPDDIIHRTAVAAMRILKFHSQGRPLDSLYLFDVLLKITSVDPIAISSQKTNKLIRSPLSTAPIAALT